MVLCVCMFTAFKESCGPLRAAWVGRQGLD